MQVLQIHPWRNQGPSDPIYTCLGCWYHGIIQGSKASAVIALGKFPWILLMSVKKCLLVTEMISLNSYNFNIQMLDKKYFIFNQPNLQGHIWSHIIAMILKVINILCMVAMALKVFAQIAYVFLAMMDKSGNYFLQWYGNLNIQMLDKKYFIFNQPKLHGHIWSHIIAMILKVINISCMVAMALKVFAQIIYMFFLSDDNSWWNYAQIHLLEKSVYV